MADERCLTLVEAIFDAAETREGLAPALARISDVLRADFAHTIAVHPSGSVDAHDHGGDPSSFAEYEREWRTQDPRWSAAAGAFGRVLSDVEVIDRRQFERSAIYNEHLRSAGVRYSLFAHAPIAPGSVLGQAFMRKEAQGAFGREHVELLDTLLPYLRRALHLRHLVAMARDQLADLRGALDALPGAAVVLDAGARIVCANAACERLFAARDGLCVEGPFLSATRTAEAQRLLAAVRDTSRFAEGASKVVAPSFRVVHVTRARGRPLGVVVAPLRPTNALRRSGDPSARVLLAVHDPHAVVHLDPSLVADLYGFTRVEALLASALARGLTLADFANERGCSEHTVRTHLKRVLDKAGARRQSDLVRVLLGSAALHLASR